MYLKYLSHRTFSSKASSSPWLTKKLLSFFFLLFLFLSFSLFFLAKISECERFRMGLLETSAQAI